MLHRALRMSRLPILLFGFTLFRGVQAQELPVASEPPGTNRHLGLSWNVALGLGYLRASAPAGPGAVSSGLSLGAAVALGGAIAEDWILAGDLSAWAVPWPSGLYSGELFTLGTLGVTVTHYFMPANVFLTLGPVGTLLIVDHDDGSKNVSDVGFGGKISVGKEWWFGPASRSGFGFGLTFIAAFNNDRGATWRTFVGGVELRYTGG